MLSDRARRVSIAASLAGTAVLVVTLVVLFVATGFRSGRPTKSTGRRAAAVPIEKSYQGKIVYTADRSYSSAPFAEDCRARGGTFNACGSICAPGVEICAEVCAYTCDLQPRGAAVSLSDQCGHPPRFDEYPAGEPYRGRTAPVDFSGNTAAQEFHTVLTRGAAAGPNFAGRYTIVGWGCGTTCQDHAIVDAATGRIVQFGLPSFYDLNYRLDSNLLAVNPAANILTDTEQHITTDYYVMHDGTLDFSCRWPAVTPSPSDSQAAL